MSASAASPTALFAASATSLFDLGNLGRDKERLAEPDRRRGGLFLEVVPSALRARGCRPAT